MAVNQTSGGVGIADSACWDRLFQNTRVYYFQCSTFHWPMDLLASEHWGLWLVILLRDQAAHVVAYA